MNPAPKTKERPTKRERLIAAARDTIHRSGYAATSLATIAAAADVPLGNVYYYFKTKEDLVRAVIEDHEAQIAATLKEAETASTPLARLERFVAELRKKSGTVVEHGCPLGCLGQDLDKAGSGLQNESKRLFAGQLQWFETQFRQAGQGERSEALAVHMLACIQGASALCERLSNAEVLSAELDLLDGWLKELA